MLWVKPERTYFPPCLKEKNEQISNTITWMTSCKYITNCNEDSQDKLYRTTSLKASDEWYHGTLWLLWQIDTVFVLVSGSKERSGGTRPCIWHAVANCTHIEDGTDWLAATPVAFWVKSNGPTSILVTSPNSIVSLNRLCFVAQGFLLGCTRIGRP